MFRKLTVFALVLVMTFALIGCGGTDGGNSEGTDGNKTSGGDRIVKYGSRMANVQTLDVWQNSLNSVFQLSDCVMDRLLDKNPETLELECNLLEDFPTVSDDGLLYTFKLKKGIKFHDGSDFTTDDVKFTFEFFYAKDTASNNTWVCDVIKGCDEMMNGTAEELSGFMIIDDYNFSIEIKYPYAAFESILAVSMLPILPHEARLDAADRWGTSVLVGTGPYKLEEFTPSEFIKLSVNKDYHGSVPDVDGIEVKNMDDSTALMEWEAGNIDLCGVPTEQVDAYRKNFSNNFRETTVVGSTRLQLNMSVAPLNDPIVRQAVFLSIDRDAIVNGYYKGNVKPINGIIPEGIPGYNKDAPDIEYNPVKAKQLLSDNGYPNGVTIQAQIRDSSTDWIQVLQLIKEQLAEAGITMEIEQLDSGTYLDRREANTMTCFLSDWYADYIDGDMYMFSLFYSTNALHNSTGVNDSWYDEEVSRARSLTDQVERTKIYRELDNYLVNELRDYVPLCQEVQFMLCSDRVSGVFMKNDLLMTFSHASIKQQ